MTDRTSDMAQHEDPSVLILAGAGKPLAQGISAAAVGVMDLKITSQAQARHAVPLGHPRLPACSPMSIDTATLSESRDLMSGLEPDTDTQAALLALFECWRHAPASVAPLTALCQTLDKMREAPRDYERTRKMNTFVRTLGQPDMLATLLDMMRGAAQQRGTHEHDLVSVSLRSAKHSVYGWCGQTKILRSSPMPTHATLNAEPGVQELLGKTPASAWSLSLHIWQANPRAQGFRFGQSTLPGVVSEPPHSHPFDFASMLSMGKIRQSTYAQQPHADQALQRPGRYDGIALKHVHGVWPPHDAQEDCRLQTLEHRVLLKAGDSYFLPCHAIHDVEVDMAEASVCPAISLFLRSESVVMPHVYMAPEMAAFHKAHPELERSGYVMDEKDWHTKLERVAAYLRGASPTLQLGDLVKFEERYAFFHV